MADRYSPAEVDEQVAACAALAEQHWSRSRIAAHLGIAKSTVHARLQESTTRTEARDAGQSTVIRRAATADLMRWAEENRSAFARSGREVIDVHRAALTATRIWDTLARMWGANLPIRVAISADQDVVRPDPLMMDAVARSFDGLCLCPEVPHDCPARDGGRCALWDEHGGNAELIKAG